MEFIIHSDRRWRWVCDSPIRQVGDLLTLCLGFWMFKRKLGKSGSRYGESRSLYSNFFGQSSLLPNSASRGVVFRLRISPRIQSQNRNGSKCSVRDLCRTDFCKNPRKSALLPCPFKFGRTKQNETKSFLSPQERSERMKLTCCRIKAKQKVLVRTLAKIERRPIGLVQRYAGMKRIRSEPLLNFKRPKWNECLR
jgi:hypothetical protein